MKKIILLLFLIILIPITITFFLPMKYANFNTLSDLKTYASFFPELPQSDTNDWANPTYKYFYNQYVKLSLFKKLLIKLRLYKHPVLNLQHIKTILQKITSYRITQKKQSPFDETISLKKGAKCFVWGDLHGAFHSFIRDLSQLKKMGIINNSLEIIQDVHFIFLGNIIDKSPYSVETLTTVLLLMDKNPKKIFYLQGPHEYNHAWENFNMKNDLLAKIGITAEEKKQRHVPLKNEINHFFNTLPITLFIKYKNEKLVCSHSYDRKNIFNDHTIKIILAGGKKEKIIAGHTGLEYLGFLQGIALWELISCPIYIYQRFFNFYYDTFVEVTIGSTIMESTLTAYNNDTRKKATKFIPTYYQAMFGYTLPNNVSNLQEKNIINIGSSIALIATLPEDKELKEGFETAIINFNNKKNTNLIRTIFLNNQAKPNLARKNVLTLYDTYNIDTLVIPSGGEYLDRYLDLIKSRKIAALFPITGIIKFRKPELKNILHFRGSYGEEAKKIIDYITTHYDVKKLTFFYPIEFGKSIAEIAHQTLKKYGITQWLDSPFSMGQKNFSEIVTQIKKYKPEALVFFANSPETKMIITGLGVNFLFERILCFPSILNTYKFTSFLKKMGLNSLFTTITPDPKTSNIQIAYEYKEAIKKRGLPVTTNSFEGYILGSLFIDAINHLQPPFTKEKILKYFANMKQYKFKGLTLTFNPETRGLSQPIGIKKIKA